MELKLSPSRQFIVMLFFALNIIPFSPATAVPGAAVPFDEKAEFEENKSPPTKDERLKTMEITIPSQKTSEKNKYFKDDKKYFYSFRESITPRLGVVFDPEELKDNFQLVFLFGFHYMLPSPTWKHYEVGFDVHTGGKGYFQLGKRWIFSKASKFRPFLRAGLSVKWLSREGFASFVNKENLQLRIAWGFEKLLASPLSGVFSAELAIGKNEQFLVLAMGYSWAW